jgi:hypothetical protein
MRRLLTILLCSLVFSANAAFDDFFMNKSLRFDYFHTGNDKEDIFSFDELIEEPYWGGPTTQLLDPFDYGEYKFTVTDISSGSIIYSHHYSSLFAEWQTTAEAKKTWKSFSETVTFPFPKIIVNIDFYKRNWDGKWEKKFEYQIDPKNYFISKEKKEPFPAVKIHYSGEPSSKLDIVIIPDGYTANEMEKFQKDCQRFAGYLLKCRPYNKNADKINIWAVEAPSLESGTDIPGDNVWKQTISNSSFYTFDSERYLTTSDNKSLHNLAANAPYDQIFLLVNTEKYGGGGIYNFYSVCSSDNKYSDFVFIHEFGHAFAGLADEYYDSEVSYQDFYNLKIEPWEPNLTTLVNFNSKWKNRLAKNTPIPTPDNEQYKNTLGVFEGGGYVAKGVYRPVIDCSMKSTIYDDFCPVCSDAIQRMIDFYAQ